MKKYLQITVVLGLFGLLVYFRQLTGGNAQPVVGTPNITNSQPSTNPQVTTPSTNSAGSGSTTGNNSGTYKDGTYTGSAADAYYGNIQVQVTIGGGKISDVQFLQSPNDNGTSRFINSQAMPLLRQEAIAAQSAQVDVVSGASDSSQAFQQSLASALQQAR